MIATLTTPVSIDPVSLAAMLACAIALLAIVRVQPDDLVDDGDDAAKRRVAIVVHDGVELLDFAGPGEVFQVAGGFAADRGRPAFRPFTVAPAAGPITSQEFVRIEPSCTIAEVPGAEVVVVPGGAIDRLLDDRALLSWLADSGAEVVLSVCTGAFAVAAAGLLDGRRATTWHGRLDRLARSYPGVAVVGDRRVVDAGRVVTTAGVTAGIDGALHVVARLCGEAIARRTATYIEHPWMRDPDLAAGYTRLDPSLDDVGRAVQNAAIRIEEGDVARAVALLADAVVRDSDHAEAWMHLARARYLAGDPAGARDASDRAVTFARTRAVALHDRACIRAAAGDEAGAVTDLNTLANEGRYNREAVLDDPDLASIRDRLDFD